LNPLQCPFQFDTLVDSLTVYEMLMYTAELKRPLSEPIASKRAAVERLVAQLALEKCRWGAEERD
jgi:ATP-binding cassette subfamily G (WHITE) protein 2